MVISIQNSQTMKDLNKLRKTLKTTEGDFAYYDLNELKKDGFNVEKLPFSIRILLENIVRNQDGLTFTENHLSNILNWEPKPLPVDIPYLPSRVLMQDFTGVPSIVDIASIRSEVARKSRMKQ